MIYNCRDGTMLDFMGQRRYQHRILMLWHTTVSYYQTTTFNSYVPHLGGHCSLENIQFMYVFNTQLVSF